MSEKGGTCKDVLALKLCIRNCSAVEYHVRSFTMRKLISDLSFLRHFWQMVLAVAFEGPLGPGAAR